jgi:DNA-binding NarL/FixJ family response regulator
MAYYQSQITKEVDLSRLTAIEFQILKFIKEGYSSPQIAGFRNCSSRTVEKHRSNIIKKLKINSTQNALLIWISKNQDVFTT